MQEDIVRRTDVQVMIHWRNYSDWRYLIGPVDPVEDVEPPVGAQREEVVASDGLRLSGLAHHEQLEK